MVNAQQFFTILLILPIFGSMILSLVYFIYLEEIKEKSIWSPSLIGFLTPLILVLFRLDLYIIGYIAWIAFAIAFWHCWKKAAKKLGNIEDFSLDNIVGIGESSTTSSNSRGFTAFGTGSLVRAAAMVGILLLYPLVSVVLNSYLAIITRSKAKEKEI